MAVEEHLNTSYDESFELNRSTDESFEFADLVASVKLTMNRPPLPDIIERPKSSLPSVKASPLMVSLTSLESHFPSLTKRNTQAFFTHAEVA